MPIVSTLGVSDKGGGGVGGSLGCHSNNCLCRIVGHRLVTTRAAIDADGARGVQHGHAWLGQEALKTISRCYDPNQLTNI